MIAKPYPKALLFSSHPNPEEGRIDLGFWRFNSRRVHSIQTHVHSPIRLALRSCSEFGFEEMKVDLTKIGHVAYCRTCCSPFHDTFSQCSCNTLVHFCLFCFSSASHSQRSSLHSLHLQ